MSDRARELAAAFDLSFAEPARKAEARGTEVLAIRVGISKYMLRIADIATVGRAPRIVPLPFSSALQLGIAGLRGNLVTVFSLAALLGLGSDNSMVGDHETKGWIAALARHRGVAVAFGELEGHVVLATDDNAPNILDLTALLDRGGVAT